MRTSSTLFLGHTGWSGEPSFLFLFFPSFSSVGDTKLQPLQGIGRLATCLPPLPEGSSFRQSVSIGVMGRP